MKPEDIAPATSAAGANLHDHAGNGAILMRSKLFVPGARPELFTKAMRSGADAISIDLEDAVLETRKEEARQAAAAFLTNEASDASGVAVVVRVNGLQTTHFYADVEAVARPGLAVLNLPKVESVDQVREAAALLDRLERQHGMARPIGILANIESPSGLRRAAAIASAHPRLIGLQLGFGDLFEPLGIDRGDDGAVRQVQLAVRLAAGEAGIAAYDGAFVAVDDAEGFRKEAEHARRLGFQGKSCIHPTQVALANKAFAPTESDIAFAAKVSVAWQQAGTSGRGAIVVDGRMIDRPFAERAEAILAIARRLGLISS